LLLPGRASRTPTIIARLGPARNWPNVLGPAYDRDVSDASDASEDDDDAEVPLVIIGASPEDEQEGGSPVCLAHLVCEECGAVTTEGHRDWCSLAGT
jgi:hypothetical protein